MYLPRYTQIRDRRAQCGLTASWVRLQWKKKIVQRDPNMKFEAEMRGFLVAASREDHRRPNFCRGWFLSVVAIFAWRGVCSTVLGHFASFEIWGGCGISLSGIFLHAPKVLDFHGNSIKSAFGAWEEIHQSKRLEWRKQSKKSFLYGH